MSYGKRIGRLGAFCTLAAIAGLSACSGNDEVGDEPVVSSRTAGGLYSIETAVADLKAAHPNARVRVQGNRIQRLYGVTATGTTPRAAVENFRQRNAARLGVDADDLAPRLGGAVGIQGAARGGSDGVGLMLDRTTGKYKFRLFAFDQQRDGIPVFRAGLRALVREGGENPVVWANADLRPMGNFRPKADLRARAVDLDKSLQALGSLVRGGIAPAGLTRVSTPKLTIFAGTEGNDATPRTAMRYTAEDVNGAGKWTFVADLATGDILHVESNLHHDVSGTVRAEVVLGDEALECGTLGIAPLAHAEVVSSAGNAFTDASGAFTIVQSGSAALNVTSSITGQFFDVSNEAGSVASISLSVTPPGPASFLHEDTAVPPELVLAQLNAYKQANELRDLLLEHVPEYPVIATQTNFPITVNRTGLLCEQTGGAFYDNDSAINSMSFCQRTAERANAAFASIVHHEYGHHIIEMGGSGQNEYGEGMADTIAMIFAKDPRIGVGYYLNDCAGPLRRADSDCSYSTTECSSCGFGNYVCGAVLSGTIWDVWQELEVSEPAAADDIIRSLTFSSIPLHTGTSIDPSLAIDFLTLDDDDGLIENGTPHYTEICAGFEAHNLECPPLVDGLVVKGTDLDAEGPSGGPFAPESVSYTLHNLGPQQTISYTVSTGAPWLTVNGGGGTIALGGQATVTVSLNQAQAALLADGHYSATINFVNATSGVGTTSREAKLQVGAPVPIYTATFDSGNDGFTIDTEDGNLWRHTTTCVDPLPGHTTGGSLHYSRLDACNYATPLPIRHTITSPLIRVANPAMAELGFNYFLQTENQATFDHADVLVSVDGGPFQIVASNNNGGVKLEETSAWRAIRFEIWQQLPATGPTDIRVQLAFNAVDPENNQRQGFAVDDIVVYAQPVSCTSNAQCNDNRVCNGAETCVNQVCVSGAPPDCNDQNPCTNDGCNDATGCVYVPNTNQCEDDGDQCTNDVCGGGACTHPDNGTCEVTNAFVEQNGRVVMEAEHFVANTPRSGHVWDLRTISQGSGQQGMTANPNSGVFINTNFAGTSPELRYPVRFSTTGTYYVWIRGIGQTANDDSCHVGLDGVGNTTADRMTGWTTSLGWTRNTIDGPPATLQVSQAGVRDVSVWMREDGFTFDKILLTTSASFVPSGNGPAESPREGPGPCTAYCSNPIAFNTSNYQSGNLGTAASCHETRAPLHGAVCGNLQSPRQLFVNGVPMTCNFSPVALPPAQNGGYCIHTTSGNYAWASFATW